MRRYKFLQGRGECTIGARASVESIQQVFWNQLCVYVKWMRLYMDGVYWYACLFVCLSGRSMEYIYARLHMGIFFAGCL